MNKTELAKRIHVTRQTLSNWEKSKPELIRLIQKGLVADDQYLQYLQLFPKNGAIFIIMHDFYIDFYFKFLNYFRQNITKNKIRVMANKTDIFSTTILYLMEKDKNQLFDSEFKVSEFDASKFARDDFKKPLFITDKNLSKYILKNTLDDFETLIKDIILNDENQELFLNAMQIAIMYLVYKHEPSIPFSEKQDKFVKILLNDLFIDLSNPEENIDIEKVYCDYLKFREKYTKKHMTKLVDELNLYTDNNFYVPNFMIELNG